MIEWFVDDSIPENTIYMYDKTRLIVKKYPDGSIKIEYDKKEDKK